MSHSYWTISYPGLSAELTIDKNFQSHNFYELVSSCGVFCRLPREQQISLLNSLKQNNPSIEGVIFLTDTYNVEPMGVILRESKIQHFILSFDIDKNINELGLRINHTNFKDGTTFKELLKDHPRYLVIVSTPYSCPDLAPYISNQDTLANRSSLFYFENKSIYCEKFRDEMGFIAYIESIDSLMKYLEDKQDNEKFFIKPSGNFVGGSNILVLDKKALQFRKNINVVQHLLGTERCGLYRKLLSSNIVSPHGEHNGTQFRPFVNTKGELVGFAVKFSSYATKSNLERTSLKRLNQAYNSSSGSSASIIFSTQDIITPVSLSFGKHKHITDKQVIEAYVDSLYINEHSLSKQETLCKISNAIKVKMVDINNYFEGFFFEQSWDDLYDKFVLSKTYFNAPT